MFNGEIGLNECLSESLHIHRETRIGNVHFLADRNSRRLECFFDRRIPFTNSLLCRGIIFHRDLVLRAFYPTISFMKRGNQKSRHHMLFLHIYDINSWIFLHDALDSFHDSIIYRS